MASLNVGLSKAEKRLQDRERGLDATKRAMEGMARGRQEEVESRIMEVKRAEERPQYVVDTDVERGRPFNHAPSSVLVGGCCISLASKGQWYHEENTQRMYVKQ